MNINRNKQQQRISTSTIVIVGVLGSIAVIATVLLVNKIINKLKHNKSKDLIKDADKEIEKPSLTYREVDYQSMADSLFGAMDGVGTSWQPIVTVIKKLKTHSDWYALIKAFGVRETTSSLSTFKGNLIDWFSDELDESEYKYINDKLKLINVTI